MRVALISMSGVRVRSEELAALGVSLPGFVQRGKVIASMPSLALLTLAAVTPSEVEILYLDVADIHQHGLRMIIKTGTHIQHFCPSQVIHGHVREKRIFFVKKLPFEISFYRKIFV